MRHFHHAIRPDNRMDQTLFVRPVTLRGVGSAMLHQGFISRASDVMTEQDHVKDLLYRVRCGHGLTDALCYLWSDDDKQERDNRFASFVNSKKLPKWIKSEVIGFLSSKPKSKSKAEPKPTFLYLMAHSRNGCFKIGMSRIPHARESTLQAEDPELKMVGFWQATTAHEQAAHAMFAGKRVRGEWFRLDADDLKAFSDFVATIQSKNSGQGGTKLDAPLALPEVKKENLRAPEALLKALVAGMRVEAK